MTSDERQRIQLIWVSDDPLWAQQLREGELTASFPIQWLQDGVSISVSSSSAPYELTTHPERLKLPESLKQRLADATKGTRFQITSMRRVSRDWGGTIRRFVVVVITGPTSCTNSMNNVCVVQIGRKEFVVWAERNVVTCEIADEEFAALEDGSPVRINWGENALRNGYAGKSFARLDKRTVVDESKR